jgi:hypothetical protein
MLVHCGGDDATGVVGVTVDASEGVGDCVGVVSSAIGVVD